MSTLFPELYRVPVESLSGWLCLSIPEGELGLQAGQSGKTTLCIAAIDTFGLEPQREQAE